MVVADFSNHPVCAQAQLESNIPSECDFGDSQACICNDIEYLTTAAEAIAQNCDCTEVALSASQAFIDCNMIGSPMVMSADEFVDAAGCFDSRAYARAAAPLPSYSAYAEPPATPGTTTSSDPKANKIALGVGLGIGIPSLIIAAATLWKHCC
jgi:hypothetical protein